MTLREGLVYVVCGLVVMVAARYLLGVSTWDADKRALHALLGTPGHDPSAPDGWHTIAIPPDE